MLFQNLNKIGGTTPIRLRQRNLREINKVFEPKSHGYYTDNYRGRTFQQHPNIIRL
jgi:hypothetical protein